MATCPGKLKTGAKCTAPLYKCKSCGNVGCQSPESHACSNRAFDAGSKCMKCGKAGQKERFN
jgi:hypothetical protein